jgi:hypothetical protein
MNIHEYFNDLRHNSAHHLGMGDIRITQGQQDEIIAEFDRLSAALESIAGSSMSHFVDYRHAYSRSREKAIAALANVKSADGAR